MSKSGARIIKAAGEAVLHAQVERLQADVARLTAERDAALALVAEAYESAANVALHGKQARRESIAFDIAELTPADALAALARRDARMRAEGMREAVKIAWDSAQNMVGGNLHDRGRQTAFVELSIAVSALADKTEKGEV